MAKIIAERLNMGSQITSDNSICVGLVIPMCGSQTKNQQLTKQKKQT